MQKQPVAISGEVLRDNTPYDELIPRIEEAFSAYERGLTEMPEKSYVQVDKYNGDFRSMPAYVEADGWEASGVKWVNVHPDNTDVPTVMGTFVYTDPENGEPLAVMDGTEMTKRRTAAVAAMATDRMADKESSTLGILGAGDQSYEQVRAISVVRDIQEIFVSDKDPESIENFKSEFSDHFDITPVGPSDLSRADIVCTLTPVESPIIDEMNEVSHINAMGADAPSKQELDPDILNNSSVIVDDREQAVHSGEVSKPIDNNVQIGIDYTLGEIVANDVDLTDDRSVFDSTGLAIQDVATASLVMDSVDSEELDTVDIF